MLWILLLVTVLIHFWRKERSANQAKKAQGNSLLQPSNENKKTAITTWNSFENVILPSSGNTPHTEIDQIIVSPFGIFCIELKAHKGFIFGSKQSKRWTQCKYDGKYPMHNPIHQNYKHTQAITHLLGERLNAPVHSFVLFYGAQKVVVDSDKVFSSADELQLAIEEFSNQIYSKDELAHIISILEKAQSESAELLETHIAEVNAYLALQKV